MRRLAFASLLFAASLAAQETVTVSVTNVDVFVTSKGQRVHGLTKDDFEVFENGKKRDITNFSEINRAPTVEAATPGAQTTTTGAAEIALAARPVARRILIYVDNASLNMDNRRLFVAAAHEFVAQNAQPGDAFAIVSATQSLTLRLPWTTDRAAVDAKLNEIGQDALVGARDVDRRSIENRLQDVLTHERLANQGTEAKGSLQNFDTLTQNVRQYAQREYNASRASLAAINASFNLFPMTGERKMFVLAGEGVPMRAAMGLWQMLDQIRSEVQNSSAPSGLRAGSDNVSPVNDASEFDLSADIQKFARAAARRGVIVYALNPGVNEAASGATENRRNRDKSLDFENMAANNLSYQMLARETGGLAFTGTKPALAFAEIVKDSDSYYSIGFRSDTAKDIVVKSKKGYEVRQVVATAPASRDDVMRDSVLANHVVAPQLNDLKIALAADPAVAADGGRRKVPVKVLIPVDALLLVKDGAEVTGGFNVYIAAGDARGNVATVNKQTHQIRWPPDAQQKLAGRSMTFAVEVLVDPGADQISVGVLDQRSERTGFAVLKL